MLSFLNDLWGGDRRPRSVGGIDEMRLAMDALPLGVALADATLPGEPIVYVNRRFSEVTGAGAGEALGRPLASFAGEALEILPLPGGAGTAARQLAVLSEAGALRHKVAELTRRIEEAERIAGAKSRFFAAASHDLRQPLQALALFASALEPHVTTGAGQTILGAVKQSLATMDEMFGSLLDMSRLEAGVLKAEPKVFVIDDLLDRLEAEFMPLASAKGLGLTLVHSSATVRSDPALLARILRNLLSNAVRYTDHGRILVGCRHRRGALSVQVADTGPGIAEDQRQAIFQEFFQGRRSNSGMGLGLAIVQRLAGLLGHDLDVRSVPGRGSLFSVTVPKGVFS